MKHRQRLIAELAGVLTQPVFDKCIEVIEKWLSFIKYLDHLKGNIDKSQAGMILNGNWSFHGHFMVSRPFHGAVHFWPCIDIIKHFYAGLSLIVHHNAMYVDTFESLYHIVLLIIVSL